MSERKVRVLIAKPGLDGHDQGAKVVARALIDAGFDVAYTGLRQTPEQIAAAARDHGVDVIGISSLAGSHLPFCRHLKSMLEQYQLVDKVWIIGGNIPAADHEALRGLGIAAVFSTGSKLSDIVDFIRQRVP